MRRSTRKLKATVARIRDASLEEDTIPLDEIGETSQIIYERLRENLFHIIFINIYPSVFRFRQNLPPGS